MSSGMPSCPIARYLVRLFFSRLIHTSASLTLGTARYPTKQVCGRGAVLVSGPYIPFPVISHVEFLIRPEIHPNSAPTGQLISSLGGLPEGRKHHPFALRRAASHARRRRRNKCLQKNEKKKKKKTRTLGEVAVDKKIMEAPCIPSGGAQRSSLGR